MGTCRNDRNVENWSARLSDSSWPIRDALRRRYPTSKRRTVNVGKNVIPASPLLAGTHNREYNYYRRLCMTRQFDVVVEKDSEGYFVATVPALPGCHTQAKSLDELMSRIKEAIELCLEVEGSPGEPLDFIGVQRVTVSA